MKVITRPFLLVVVFFFLPGWGPALAQTIPIQGEPALFLNDLVKEALEVNPQIRAAERRLEAVRARIPSAGALPDPMLSIRLDNISERLTIGEEDMSMAGVEVSQMIPFPGKRSLMKQMAEQEAERENAVLEATRRRVIAELKRLYYRLYLTSQSRATIEQMRLLFQALAGTAQARYGVGEGLQQDVLRAQTELARLFERATEFELQEGAIQLQLNALLRRPPEAELGRPGPLQAAPLPVDRTLLTTHAKEQAPDLQAAERMVAMKERALNLARREYYPDFEVTVGYLDRGGLDSMYEAMVSFNLPIYFRSRQTARVQEAAKDLDSMQEERIAAEQFVTSKTSELYLEAAANHRLLELFTTGILPQARLSLESARAGYAVGKVDFLTVLDNALKLLEDELGYQEILVRYQKSLVGLEELTGLNLTVSGESR